MMLLNRGALSALVFSSLLLCCGKVKAATPPCWPSQVGSTGSGYKTGATPDGTWLGWTCKVKGKSEAFGVWAVTGYQIVHPPTAGLTPIKTAAAYWAANVRESADPRQARLRAAMAEAFR